MFKASTKQWGLIKEVASHFGTTPEEMETKRYRNASMANYVCYRIFRLDGLSYPQIGQVLCKDHTTVIHGDEKLSQYPECVEYALMMYAKYKNHKVKYAQLTLKEQADQLLLERERIKKLYNKGMSIEDICAEMNQTDEFVKTQIKYFEIKCEKKAIPNYKTHETRYIYL